MSNLERYLGTRLDDEGSGERPEGGAGERRPEGGTGDQQPEEGAAGDQRPDGNFLELLFDCDEVGLQGLAFSLEWLLGLVAAGQRVGWLGWV
jgi:hypothetical protein